MMLLAMLTLASRLHAITGEHEYFVETYDRYSSGRPRRVVVAVNLLDDGELLLARLPDDDRGSARLLDRQAIDFRPVGIRFEKLVDRKDVIVDLFVPHPPRAIVDRVVGDRLIGISNDYTDNAADLDGDGIPEIISSGYIGPNHCGGGDMSPSILRWNGRRYHDDGRHYVAFAKEGREYETRLSASKHYVVHLYGRGKALLDDEVMTPGMVFMTEDDCHVLAVRGAKGTWAFLEERP
jgi:hypothetical protein